MRMGVSAAILLGAVTIASGATPLFAEGQARSFDVPAGTLKSALDSYVRQSGRQLIYRVKDVMRARSPGAEGHLSADAALRALLTGSGFDVIEGPSGTAAIVRSGPQGLAMPAGSERVRLAQAAYAASGAPIADDAPIANRGNDAPGSPPQATAENMGGDIVVTARRREEAMQKTPIAISAFNAGQIRETGATNIQAIGTLVPGVNFTGSGARSNTVYVIRGLSRGSVGQAQSAVVTYLNEVPLSVWAASLPAYDMASIQVLKGPQGTLFGRNATAGAILATTAPPTDAFGGYLDATVGSFATRTLEGALNLPIVADSVAVRIAGKLDRRDGYTRSQTFPGRDLSDRNENNLRISLLVHPSDTLTNTTVFEYQDGRTHGDGIIPIAYIPGGFTDLVPYTNGTFLNPITGTACNGLPICSIQAVVARQQAAGPRKAWSNARTVEKTRIVGVINTTRLELSDQIALKNIVSYRSVSVNLKAANGDGSEMSLIGTHPTVNNRTVTEELQLSGSFFDDNLSLIGGLFYSDFAPDGGNRLTIQAFALPGTPLDAPAAAGGATGTSDYYYEKSYAGYLNGSLNLADILPGLKFDAGVRFTKDTQRLCDLPNVAEADPIIGPGACSSTPGANILKGYKDNITTWNIGVDYQVTDKVLAYFTTRRGFRMGGINAPVFAGTLIPFQRYAPETVQDYEIGLKTNWRVGEARGHFNIAAYKTDISNLQASVATSGSPCPDGVCDPAHFPANTSFYGNAGEATVKGIEAEASISPTRNLTLSAGAAWLNRKITSLTFQLPTTLPASAITLAGVQSFAFLASPDHSYTADLRYILPLDPEIGQLVFNTHFYSISKFEFGTVIGGGYSTVNFRLDWNSIFGRPVDAALFVTNATDKAGIVAGSLISQGLGLSTGIYNEPRIIGAQLRYHFGAE